MKIFLSYARTDRAQIEDLARFLVQSGHDAWFDFRLLPGQDWKGILSAQIAATDVFLYALSKSSVASEWCRWELGQALSAGKPVLPVTLDGVAIPTELRHLHAVPWNLRDRILGGIASQSAQGVGHRIERDFSFPSAPRGRPSRVPGNDPSPFRHLHLSAINSGRTRIPEGLSNSSSGRIIGIDFGTTSSLCAIIDNGTPRIIPNRFGAHSTPSAVFVRDKDNLVVGEPAVSSILRNPAQGVLNVKRLMGINAELHACGRIWSGAELAAEVLRTLIADASKFLDTTINRAVVSVPAYFTELQLGDLKTACHLAGLQVVRILPEPVAACLTFESPERLQNDDFLTIAVVDLGGGTFDVSILRYKEDWFQVEAIGGESELGGIDYDEVIVDYCITTFCDQTGVNLADHIGARMRIRDAAEKAKIELTSSPSAQIFVPFIFADSSGAIDLMVTLTKQQFLNLTEQLTARICECCRNTLREWRGNRDMQNDAGNVDPWWSIDRLLFVGLPTRTPEFQERLAPLFNCQSLRGGNPETCVALGAAIQAGIIEGTVRESYLLIDALPHDLCIETTGGLATPMLLANTVVPIKKSQDFSPERVGQTHVQINILQGMRKMARDNLLLGSIVFEMDVEQHPQLRVTFDVDTNQNLRVSIVQKGTSASRTVSIRDRVFEELPRGIYGGVLRQSVHESSINETKEKDEQRIGADR